jgi:hypothetical protein
VKYLSMQFSPTSHHFLLLMSKYFPQHPVLCSSLSVRKQVAHPYKTRGKIIVSYILIFKLLERRREDKWILPLLICLSFRCEFKLDMLPLFLKILTLPHS